MATFRFYLGLAGLAGFSAVAMGAFGAHALRTVLDPRAMAVYHTAVEYHLAHAMALGLVAIILRCDQASRLLIWSARLMFAGILLFSGSLYGLSISKITWLGAITPFGGTAFLLAWAFLAIHSFRNLNRD